MRFSQAANVDCLGTGRLDAEGSVCGSFVTFLGLAPDNDQKAELSERLKHQVELIDGLLSVRFEAAAPNRTASDAVIDLQMVAASIDRRSDDDGRSALLPLRVWFSA